MRLLPSTLCAEQAADTVWLLTDGPFDLVSIGGPFHIDAGDVYGLGVLAGETYTLGASAADLYTMGSEASQLVTEPVECIDAEET